MPHNNRRSALIAEILGIHAQLDDQRRGELEDYALALVAEQRAGQS